jgi:signal transduction histidine kinase
MRLRQVILNLMGNAVKFTHIGYVKIKIKILKNENGIIDFDLSVIDTGIGIAEKDHQRIFDSFIQYFYEIHKKKNSIINECLIYI